MDFAEAGDAFRAASRRPTGGILVGISGLLCLAAGLANETGAGLLWATCCSSLHLVDICYVLRNEIGPTPLDSPSAPCFRGSSQ